MRKLALASLAVIALWLGAPAPAHAWSSWSSHGGGGWGHGGGWNGHGWNGHGGGSHFVFVPRVFIGGGPFWYGYPPYPYGYGYGYGYGYAYPYPQPVIVQQAPQVYVQPPATQQYWYYCQDPAGYYPSVTQCRAGWIQVVPSSPAGQ